MGWFRPASKPCGAAPSEFCRDRSAALAQGEPAALHIDRRDGPPGRQQCRQTGTCTEPPGSDTDRADVRPELHEGLGPGTGSHHAVEAEIRRQLQWGRRGWTLAWAGTSRHGAGRPRGERRPAPRGRRCRAAGGRGLIRADGGCRLGLRRKRVVATDRHGSQQLIGGGQRREAGGLQSLCRLRSLHHWRIDRRLRSLLGTTRPGQTDAAGEQDRAARDQQRHQLSGGFLQPGHESGQGWPEAPW